MDVTTSCSLNFTAVAPPSKTSLSKSPPPEPFQPGLDLGKTINALTGEIGRRVIDINKSPGTTVNTGQVSEAFRFKQFSSASEAERSTALNFQTSIAIPVDGLNVSVKRGFDFSSSNKTQAFSLFYLIQWEKVGTSTALPENPSLYQDAQDYLKDNKFKEFRSIYGDYYVHQIVTRSRFTALWRCTGTTETSMRSFQTDLNVGVKAPGDIGGTASFEASLKNSSSKNNVTLEVQFDTLGSADDVTFDMTDVTETLKNFRSKVKAADDQVYYRHHSVFKAGYPTEIDMDPDLYLRTQEIFATANFIAFLNGVTPGTATTRLKRREIIKKIYNNIYSKRLRLEGNDSAVWENLKNAIQAMETIRGKLLALLDRQEIVLKVTNMTVKEIVRLFWVDHENVNGHWINGVYGKRMFQFGETSLDSYRYGVSTSTVSVKRPGVFLQQAVDALNFPEQGRKGTAVGITVIPNWTDGTNGYWCIPTSNPLGTEKFKIGIKSEGSRGMDWTLRVDYIPDSEYADMQFNGYDAVLGSS